MESWNGSRPPRPRSPTQPPARAAAPAWNRLSAHHHLHCLVPGGAWDAKAGTWRTAHRRYLFGKNALAACFRARYLRRLESLHQRGKLRLDGPPPRWPSPTPGMPCCGVCAKRSKPLPSVQDRASGLHARTPPHPCRTRRMRSAGSAARNPPPRPRRTWRQRHARIRENHPRQAPRHLPNLSGRPRQAPLRARRVRRERPKPAASLAPG